MSAVEVAEEVALALRERRPVVALETSIVSQGLPAPRNLETALRCESEVRANGAVPATIGMLGGRLKVGLSVEELERLADPAASVLKLSSRDIGPAMARGADGATTVAATLRAASLTGIRFLATGGIGGVHRGRPEDESADLFELTRAPVAVFCSGVKTILDVPVTLERLESLGVVVLGYGCDEFPAFYSAHSGRPVPARVEDAAGAARALAASWATGSAGAVVAIPPPVDLLGAAGIVEQALTEEAHVQGPEATPALLARVAELSGGRSVEVNVALVANNAAKASECAAAWSALEGEGD